MYRFKPFKQDGVAQGETAKSRFYHVRGVRSVMLTKGLLEQQYKAIARIMHAFCLQTRELRSVTFEDVVQAVHDYWAVFESWPSENVDCSRHANGMWIYCLTRLFNPDVAVESGTYHGFGTFLMGKACRPGAVKVGFDVDLAPLFHKLPETTYCQGDWTGADLVVPPSLRGFGFFDDHVSHALRVVEAYDRGFRGLLFDDNWPFCALHFDGWPPVPNIDMIMDETLQEGAEARWMYDNTLFHYVHTPAFVEQCLKARPLIEGVFPLPSVFRETGICCPTVMIYVELKQH